MYARRVRAAKYLKNTIHSWDTPVHRPTIHKVGGNHPAGIVPN